MSDFSSHPLGSHVNGIGPVHRTGLHTDAPRAIAAGDSASEPATVESDRVEVSSFARYLDQLRQLPAVRHDRVETMREAVKSDEYITDEKVDAALSQWAREEL
jgi:hypothetical protein